jgi:2-C-methyl-D-erythritol 4-phosphate cytidylyltransferase/2-C-methyl-D-erythritol 2,4-cyclodiphosphate synthase
VKIAHTHSLEGHSDADVALHALTDALLGAVGEDDIGHFFPPSDEQWRGVASDQFVSHAVQLINSKGGRIVNVDITLMCEAPKVGPYRLRMRERLAAILKISPSRVNVKATTTEKLGFIGRGEGIAAQAIANVEIKSND